MCAARLARVAGRLGALDDRLRRGPEGWRHRLALIEAADLSWFVGDRIGPDRLALWISMRLSGVQDDTAALARVGWAVRRLTGGPGPEADLPAFLDRRDPENMADEAEPFANRASGWTDVMAQAANLHPISRACMGFHLWNLAGLGHQGDRMEAAATAGRIAVSESKGAVFAPLAIGGAGGLSACGRPAERLARWLDGMDRAALAAMGHLDDIEAWSARAENHHGLTVGAHPSGLARRADRMAPCVGPDGRGADRCQPSRSSAEPGLDGNTRSYPRGNRAGAVSHVACGTCRFALQGQRGYVTMTGDYGGSGPIVW